MKRGKPPDTRLYRIKLCHVFRPEAPRLPTCFVDLLFDLENGVSTFLRNVGNLLLYYTASVSL
jgi:hypothetical protein